MLPEVRAYLRGTVVRVTVLLKRALSEDHTTSEVAESFSVGAFLAMLPTLGVGPALGLFFSAVLDRVSKLAVLAAIVVFNPIVKTGVYALSLALGFLLLGPIEGVSLTGVSLDAAPAVLVRLVVGNVALAIVAAVVSYLVAYRLVNDYRTKENSSVRKAARRMSSVTDGGEDSSDSSSGQDNS